MKLKNYISKPFPNEVATVLAVFEKQYGLNFDGAMELNKEALESLHKPTVHSQTPNAIIGNQELIQPHAKVLKKIANLPQDLIEDKQREEFLNSLIAIYSILLRNGSNYTFDDDVHFIGIEREGAILAELLDMLPPSRSSRPHAKRATHNGGIIVGVSKLPTTRVVSRLVITDGAIASGSTLIAVLSQFDFERAIVYSAHATEQGVRAVNAFAKLIGKPIILNIGYMSGILNEKFYAKNNKLYEVGDLGDMIAPLFIDKMR
ncbi:MAG: hypothetical protein ABJN69_10725 [Hellea sp.]